MEAAGEMVQNLKSYHVWLQQTGPQLWIPPNDLVENWQGDHIALHAVKYKAYGVEANEQFCSMSPTIL